MSEVFFEKVEVHPSPEQQQDVIILDATTGTVFVGGHNRDGSIVLKDDQSNEKIQLNGANIFLGGKGEDGNIYVFPSGVGNNNDGNLANIRLDGQNGNVILKSHDGYERVYFVPNGANMWLGGKGQDGSIFIFPSGVGDNNDASLANVRLDGQNGVYGSTNTPRRAGVRGVGSGNDGQGVYGSHSGNGHGVYGETRDMNNKSGVVGTGPFRGVTGSSDGGVGVYGTTNSIEYPAVQAENTGNGPALNLRAGKLTIAPGSGTSPGGRTVGSVVVDSFSDIDAWLYRGTKTITNSHATGSSLIFLTCEHESPVNATVTRTAPGEFDIVVEIIDPRGPPRPLEARTALIFGSVKVNYLIIN